MINHTLIEPEVENFLRKNLKADIPLLILKGSPFPEITAQEMAIQLKGLQVAEKKFPTLYESQRLIYPPQLNLEQTSSEIAAKYKAELISGEKAIDITGGFGIDSFFLSKNFKDFHYCELNQELTEIAQHNFEQLNSQIQVHNDNGLEYLANSGNYWSWIYTDPARRDDHGGKVFRFTDCTPDIPSNLELLFSKSDNILIKSSPIVDISAGINELKFVAEIHIVAINNEVKELLWILKKGFDEEILIKTINIGKKKSEIFEGKKSDDESAELSQPLAYLYEPNSAVMKSGLFDLVARKTETKKLHQHSHLYTSEKLVNFPGRKFQITKIKSFNVKYLKKKFKDKKANITIRNFSESVDSIRKKLKIKDGGSEYIFFTTNLHDEKIVITCKKV